MSIPPEHPDPVEQEPDATTPAPATPSADEGAARRAGEAGAAAFAARMARLAAAATSATSGAGPAATPTGAPVTPGVGESAPVAHEVAAAFVPATPSLTPATPGVGPAEVAASTYTAASAAAGESATSGLRSPAAGEVAVPTFGPTAPDAGETAASTFGPAEPAVRDAAIPTFPSATPGEVAAPTFSSATPGASESSTGAAAAPAAGEDAAPAFSSATPGASERSTGAAAAPAAGEDAAPAFSSATPGASAATGRAVATPAAGSGESEPAALRTLRERFRAWRFAPVVEIVATVALALVLAESVQAAVVKPFVIPSQSMEPTLLPGQRVLVNRLAYDFGGTPARGDIVVFHPPSSLTCKANVPLTEPCPQGVGTHASDYFVKRVIGLPGDTLSIKDGHPVINGRELANEPYITPCSDSTSCNMPHAIVIPRGEYYMLGDNRGDSDDSRYWGPVRLSWIIGEVFATYWPIDRIGVF
jgi:signal peptidase I